MRADGRLFEDLAKMAAGAFGTLAGMREEAEAQVRQQFERVLARLDLVTREEFEVVRALAATARAEQEAMAERLAALEARLAGAAPAAKGAGARPSRRRRGGAVASGEGS
jgi:BMFP domain-containing protein YqiC